MNADRAFERTKGTIFETGKGLWPAKSYCLTQRQQTTYSFAIEDQLAAIWISNVTPCCFLGSVLALEWGWFPQKQVKKNQTCLKRGAFFGGGGQRRYCVWNSPTIPDCHCY